MPGRNMSGWMSEAGRRAGGQGVMAGVVRMPTPRRLPRVNPRLGQLTVAEATIVPHVGLPTDRRAAALARRNNTI